MKRLDKLQQAFRNVTENRYSSFYRDFYERHGISKDHQITSTDDWQKLPLLEKNDALEVSYDKRIHVPHEDLDLVRFTSGTTGSGVLCIPRVETLSVPEVHDNSVTEDTCLLSLFYPYRVTAQFRTPKPHVIGADLSRPDLTAKLAAQAGIEILQGTSGNILAFVPHLAKHYDISRIRIIELVSDRCTDLQYRALQNIFPNAQFVSLYVSAETQGAAAATAPEASYPHLLEPTADYYIEIVDEHGSVLHEPDTEGEIIITHLGAQVGFPLMRYRTGDRAVLRYIKEDCIGFEIKGRLGHSSLRITGGEIHTHEIERVIQTLKQSSISDYRALLTESDISGTPLPQLQITLIDPTAVSVEDAPSCAQAIESALRINQKSTYADGVLKGIYAPLTCTIQPMYEQNYKKIQHLMDNRK